MRFATLLALVLAGCSLATLDDYPDASEVLANVPGVLVEGQPLPLRGTIRGDFPARALLLRLVTPDAGPCIEASCGFVWSAVVELPPGTLPQPVDTSVVLPDTLVDAATVLDLVVLAGADNGYAGRSKRVTVRPADGAVGDGVGRMPSTADERRSRPVRATRRAGP